MKMSRLKTLPKEVVRERVRMYLISSAGTITILFLLYFLWIILKPFIVTVYLRLIGAI